jgi:cell wall assembly regulator SMI1
MTVSESWRIIERVLAEVAPQVAETLRPGASPDGIALLESKIGSRIPSDFRESLEVHDGQDDPSRLLGLFNYNLLSPISQVIADYEMLRGLFEHEPAIDWLVPDKIQNRIWMSGWIKFTEAEGDGYVIDMTPAKNGALGQIFYRSHDDNPTEVTATSFGTLLSRVAALMAAGAYSLNHGVIVFDELW